MIFKTWSQYRFIYISACLCLYAISGLSQAPNLEYTSPQIYFLNKPIPALAPSNTGGAVPPVIHNQVSTIAGSGAPGSDDGAALSATFLNPSAITADDAGNLYVTDLSKSLIRKITPQGIVSTIAGGGMQSFADGNGRNAFFSAPFGIAINGTNDLFISDISNDRIRKINPNADVTTFAGNGTKGNTNGTGTGATFSAPLGIAIDPAGNLYISDSDNSTIRMITPTGIVSTYAGSGAIGNNNGNSTAATFRKPGGLAIDPDNNIYVADILNNVIRKITPAGTVSTLAGSGIVGNTNGTSSLSSFNTPYAVAADYVGNVYVADFGNNLIRKITPAGTVSTLAGTGTLASTDGTISNSAFNAPIAITIDKFENIYVADFYGHKIRKITLGGYTIDKALPAGIVFDPITGQITGTPTELWPPTDYTITGYNLAGSSTTVVNISVVATLALALKIPNAFSPNGDGANDVWNIKGLENDPECTMSIFNRFGNKVYESKGYTQPWNGRYKNEDLPVGVYYYKLYLSEDNEQLTGSIMLIR